MTPSEAEPVLAQTAWDRIYELRQTGEALYLAADEAETGAEREQLLEEAYRAEAEHGRLVALYRPDPSDHGRGSVP